MLRLHLPFPPSVNSLYPGNAKKRWKSRKYEIWIFEAKRMLCSQYLSNLIFYKNTIEPLKVTYRVGKPKNKSGKITSKQMDLSNREKALSDFLVSQGIIKDDSLIHCLHMEWADIEGVDVEIEIYSKSAPTTSK